FPTDARVRDALTVGQLFPRYQILPAALEIAFDHGASDAIVSARDLCSDLTADLDLTHIVLLAVRVTQINHHALRKAGGRKFFACGIEIGCVIVRLFTAAKNDMTIFISERGNDSRVTCLRYRQKMMRMLRRADRVHRNPEVSVGAVLEAHRAR